MPREPEPMTDEELVRSVLAGDRERYAELVERYQARLVNYLHRLVRQTDDAHDLAQEVFVRVYQALDRFDPHYRFSTWLFRVAQNAAIDQIRRRRFRTVSIGPGDESREAGGRSVDVEDHAPGALAELEARERDGEVRAAIEALPWEYRELIVMRHYGELAYDEIAESKGMPLGTVKNKLFRARQMLKQTLAPQSRTAERG